MTARLVSERRQKTLNVPSKLLNADENDAIFNIIGNKCVSLGTAVVQVFLADHTSGNSRRWNKRCTGVLTFIKDNENKSYYLRVYNMKYKTLEWQQEMYNQFKYKEPRDHFHTFEADTCSAGLSFASVDEARDFAKVINGKIHERIDKRRTKTKRRQNSQMGGNAGGHQMSISGPQTGLPATPAPAPVISPAGPLKAGKNNKFKAKPKKITKDDISVPSDFRHVNHIGWHPNSGFDINNLDPDMKSLFDKAGISEEALEDDETRKQIYDVIERQGGLDAVKQQANKRAPPPAPAPPVNRGIQSRELPPPPPRHGSSLPPPPPPSRELPSVPSPVHQRPAPPNRNRTKPPMGGPPPPPPPSGRVRAAGMPTAHHPPSHGVPPPLPPGVPAPPPPPPPAPSGGPPPPPPPSASGSGMSRGLLADIQSGARLQKVTSTAPSPPATGRGALLDAIKKGGNLKHVDPSLADNSPPPSETSSGGGGGLLDALMGVMASRNQAINPSDDSDDEDDDDDWDDDE